MQFLQYLHKTHYDTTGKGIESPGAKQQSVTKHTHTWSCNSHATIVFGILPCVPVFSEIIYLKTILDNFLGILVLWTNSVVID